MTDVTDPLPRKRAHPLPDGWSLHSGGGGAVKSRSALNPEQERRSTLVALREEIEAYRARRDAVSPRDAIATFQSHADFVYSVSSKLLAAGHPYQASEALGMTGLNGNIGKIRQMDDVARLRLIVEEAIVSPSPDPDDSENGPKPVQ